MTEVELFGGPFDGVRFDISEPYPEIKVPIFAPINNQPHMVPVIIDTVLYLRGGEHRYCYETMMREPPR